MPTTNHVTRLAPSPTGTLHLGNLRTFIINWALARQNGWKIIMRIEDLDRTRVRPGASERLLDDLAWLGIDFDEGPIYQSRDLDVYREALKSLVQHRVAYRCDLSRKQVQSAASAPHSETGEQRFPNDLRATARDAWVFNKEDANYRLVVESGVVTVHDEFAGESRHSPFDEVGDFLIWTKLGVPAYQLAVVVDDARQGVSDVVRGDDLLPSAARQTLIYRALGKSSPRWWHLPLIVAEDGRRLAKRDNDTHLDHCRNAGATPERIIGLMHAWCGGDRRQERSAAQFLSSFEIDRVPREPVRFTDEDRAWLSL